MERVVMIQEYVGRGGMVKVSDHKVLISLEEDCS
jgi:hypothetical protein